MNQAEKREFLIRRLLDEEFTISGLEDQTILFDADIAERLEIIKKYKAKRFPSKTGDFHRPRTESIFSFHSSSNFAGQ